MPRVFENPMLQTMTFGLLGIMGTGATGKEISLDREVASILEKYCVTCHGPDEQENDLRVDTLLEPVPGDDLLEPAFEGLSCLIDHLLVGRECD